MTVQMKVREYAEEWSPPAQAEYMLRRFVKRYGRQPMDEVTPMQARRFASESPNHAKVAKRMFVAAVLDGVVDKNPFDSVKVPTPKTKREGKRTLTLEEIGAISRKTGERRLQVGGPHPSALVVPHAIWVAAFTGLRLHELVALNVENIVLDGDTLPHRALLPKAKGGKVRTILFPSDAAGPTLELMGDRQSGPLVRVGRRRIQKRVLQEQFVEARDALGIEKRFSWHDLRHFAVTWMLEQGASAEAVSMQMHGKLKYDFIVQCYQHVQPERMLAQLEEALR